MKLLYGTKLTDSKTKCVAKVKTVEDAVNFIKKDVLNNHLKYHYLRVTLYLDCWTFDFGSYENFYFLTDLSEDAMDQLDNLTGRGK